MDTQINKAIVYSFRRCPYAMRARLALWYSGVKFELREVVLKNKPQAMLSVSPKGTVPVLVLANGVVLEESLDIMHWAIEQVDSDEWSIQSLEDSLVERNDGYFKYYLDRYKYFDRYPDKPQQYYFEQACEFIAELESRLSTNENWLFGESQTALDMAIFPFVRQFSFVDKAAFDQLEFPKVKQWLEKLLASEIFQSIMLKYPAWLPGQEPVVINT